MRTHSLVCLTRFVLKKICFYTLKKIINISDSKSEILITLYKFLCLMKMRNIADFCMHDTNE